MQVFWNDVTVLLDESQSSYDSVNVFLKGTIH